MSVVQLYSDGSARGNPGPGGYGALLVFQNKEGRRIEKELQGGFRLTTNNRMELLAIIKGLEALKFPCEVEVYSDSRYVVNAFESHWIDGWIARGWKTSDKKPVKNIDLWQQLMEAMKSHQVSFHWVEGHQGHPENERCDTLATQAALADPQAIDVVFERTENLPH